MVAVVGTTFTGDCDDVAGIDAMLHELAGRGLEVPMHVDAASGGFVFPFSDPDFAWDFRLASVKSINVSGHKFGLVYPGVGWLVFRDDRQLPEELVFYEDYLGQRDATFTLNFSGSSAFILAQYYNFIRHGRAGYASLVRAMDANAAALATRLGAEDALELIEGSPRLPLVIARVRDDEPFTRLRPRRRARQAPRLDGPRLPPAAGQRRPADPAHAGEDQSVAGARRRARRRLPCVDHGSALAQRRPDCPPADPQRARLLSAPQQTPGSSRSCRARSDCPSLLHPTIEDRRASGRSGYGRAAPSRPQQSRGR